jgi:hypothetical protein
VKVTNESTAQSAQCAHASITKVCSRKLDGALAFGLNHTIRKPVVLRSSVHPSGHRIHDQKVGSKSLRKQGGFKISRYE